jgi:hypothetical protein
MLQHRAAGNNPADFNGKLTKRTVYFSFEPELIQIDYPPCKKNVCE